MSPKHFIFLACLALWLLPGPCRGVTPEEAFRALMRPASGPELETAVMNARAAGLSLQAIVEARLIYGVRTDDTELLTSLLPDLESVALDFKPQNSPGGLRSVEQFRGLACYARAMKALDDRDEDEFRKQVAEGLWKFPQQGAMFGSLTAKFQLNERMSHVTADFATALLTPEGGSTTLSDLLGTQKALLLEFWSTQGEESVSSVPGIVKRGTRLKALGIVSVGVNIDIKDGDLAAGRTRDEQKITLPWLAEGRDHALSRQLDVSSLPRAVLISQAGKVLFNGSPEDAAFGKALRRVVPTLPGLAR